MSAVALKYQSIIGGAFVSIIEMGTTFGDEDNVASLNLYPTDADEWQPLENCFDGVIEPQFESTKVDIALPTGGYWTRDRRRLVGVTLKFNFENMCEPLFRMMLAAKAKLANGTAVTPFAAIDPAIYCWLNFQLRDEMAVDTVKLAIPGMLRFDSNPKWSKQPTFPALAFEVYKSPIMSAIPMGVNAA